MKPANLPQATPSSSPAPGGARAAVSLPLGEWLHLLGYDPDAVKTIAPVEAACTLGGGGRALQVVARVCRAAPVVMAEVAGAARGHARARLGL